jgi:hypothetical protein
MSELIHLQLEDDAASDADQHRCAFCGKPLTVVRPGKYQCDECEAWLNYPVYHLADTPRCALPDLRYVLYAGVVLVGAVIALIGLLGEMRRDEG